jgi:hypothetical protein
VDVTGYASDLGTFVLVARVEGTTQVPARGPGQGGEMGLSAYPNPARGGATIRFSLGSPQAVTVRIFDVAGHVVRRFMTNRPMPAGEQQLVWDGLSDSGTRLHAGVYFVKVQIGSGSAARKVVLIQ